MISKYRPKNCQFAWLVRCRSSQTNCCGSLTYQVHYSARTLGPLKTLNQVSQGKSGWCVASHLPNKFNFRASFFYMQSLNCMVAHKCHGNSVCQVTEAKYLNFKYVTVFLKFLNYKMLALLYISLSFCKFRIITRAMRKRVEDLAPFLIFFTCMSRSNDKLLFSVI